MKRRAVTCLLTCLLLLTAVAPVSAATQDDINRLKMYSKITDYYCRLEWMGAMLEEYPRDLYTAYVGVTYLNNSIGVETDVQRLLNNNNSYNSLVAEGNALAAEALNYGMYINDLQTILGKYGEALSYDKKAMDSLQEYRFTRSFYSDKMLFDYRGKAYDSAAAGYVLAVKDYSFYYGLLQNY